MASRPSALDRVKGADKFPHKDSPKGAAKKTSLRGVRRRLSVTSDNKLIEGFSDVPDTGDESAGGATTVPCAVQIFSGVSKKGYAPYNPSKKNQDSMIMAEDRATGAMLFSALDGHGEAGDYVSQYFRNRLPKAIFGHPSFLSDPGAVMTECLNEIEMALIKDVSIDTEFSGTTGVLAVIIGDTMTVANVGDSRVIIGKMEDGKLVAEEVSHDHKPDDPKEKARILKAGGRVFAVEYEDGIDGPARVWLGHMDIPGLAMSRSLGDTVAHTAGVSSVPDIYTRKITSDDMFMIMASDGLWEFMDNDMCVQMASKYSSPKKAVEAMVSEANTLWMKMEQVVDDTTVIVAHFQRF